MKTFGRFIEEAKATYCGRCGTRHVPPSKGGTCPALKEEVDYDRHFSRQSQAVQNKINHHLRQGADYPTAARKAGATAIRVGKLKEGYVPTADEPTEHDKKMAQKVRDLLAKEKNPRKEKDIQEDSRTPQEKVDHAIRNHRYDLMRTTSPAQRMEMKADHEDFLKAMKKKHPEVRIQEETEIEGAGTRNEFRKQKIMHKGEHVATVHTYRGRAGGWASSAHTPDGKDASKKYGIDLMDTKKQIISKIKNYHKGN